MRKVKVGAIQPGYLPTPPRYDCMGGEYVNDPCEIVEMHVKSQIQVTLDLIGQAGREGCGIVTTSEDACVVGGFGIDTTGKNIFPALLDLAAPILEEGLSQLARKYAMYVIGCYFKRTGGRNYNVASLFDRSGHIVGEYRKTHLPAYEKWQVTEGSTLSAFDTEYGKMGICICYDMMFPECVEAIALSGAEIIFHPTAGYGWYDSIGEATLRTRANDNSIHIVTSKNHAGFSAGKSSVIDHWGQVLADAGFNRDVVVMAELDLDVPKAQPEWHFPTQTSGIAGLRERNLRERRPELYGPLSAETHERLCLFPKAEQGAVIEKIKEGLCRW